ncbi:MAG: carbohydrate ABC transporter permease [Acidisphaera sp.]|nr:carbohydrate ABC transporter permease [Acidisphaera sp.]
MKIAVVLLSVGGLVMIAPIAMMFSMSLMDTSDIYNLSLFPTSPTLENYLYLLTQKGFALWFLNSTLVAVGTTASVLFFDSLAGYTLAKFRFRGRSVVFVAILSTLMIPTEMLVIPWYVMARSLGWLDTLWGVAFPGIMTGFGTFLMRQFFLDVPDDLLDAARIDGMAEFAIFLRVAMPLVRAALSALAILTFLGSWTAFLWPLIATTDPARYTLPVGLASLQGEFQTDWAMIMTGSALATLPTLLVFLLLQRHIVNGIALTGLKA